MRRYLAIIFSLVLLLATASPVSASINLVYHQYTQGGASAHVEERLVECFMSDDVENNIYEGTLAVGESITVTWDWCAETDIVMEPGHAWEGSFEGLAVNMTGKGQFDLTLYENGIPLQSHAMTAPRGYQAWHRCATYHNRVDVTGTSYGSTTLVLTNIGTKGARDISMSTWVQTNHSGFLNNNCPFTEDWGI